MKEKTIFDAHLKDLEASGISQETAMDAGLYSMKTQDLVLRFGIPLTINTDGLVFPYSGDGYSRVKYFPPVKTEKGQMKYGQAKGSFSGLYIRPKVREILNDPSKNLVSRRVRKKS